MKNKNAISVISILTIIILLTLKSSSLANSIDTSLIKPGEISDDYKKYLSLSEEEKNDRVVPELYNIPKYEHKSKNLIRNIQLVGSSVQDRKFNLMSQDQLGDNIKIKDQKSTTECWAFSALSSLETNLALKNKKNNVPQIFYDFSERHMDYSNVRNFKNNQINIYGSNRTPSIGGTYEMALSYLTNGMGAINELDMPFEDDKSAPIDISNIQNKNVKTRVYDTMNYPSYGFYDNKTEIIKLMKDYIINYGSIATKVYSDISDTEYYNNSTGAAYYDEASGKLVNHGVSIIGWDDDYSKDNFSANHRPNNNGAWIIRNSWGEKLEYTFNQMKDIIFSQYPDINEEQNWNSPSDIPDAVVAVLCERLGYTVDSSNKKVYYKIGDNGLMYYSYEDCNIYKDMFSIIDASTDIDYDNIYQYNENGNYTTFSFPSKTLYQANKFTAKSTNEYLTQVGFYTPQECDAKVYVNLSSSSTNKNDLTPVALEAGDYESLNPGFHTLEFAEPLKINSNEFVVVVESNNTTSSDTSYISLEGKIPNSLYSDVKLETGKCFFTTGEGINDNDWVDLSLLNTINSSLYSGDSTIKAYTTINIPTIAELTEIKITSKPSKTTYNEGENFNSEGLQVTAYYSDNTSRIITDYSINNGSNLKKGQDEITISYQGKSITLEINVIPNENPTPTITPSVTPDPTVSPTITPSVTPEPTTTPSITPEPTNTITPTPTPNPTGTPKPDQIAVNSDLSNLKASITGVKNYKFTDNADKNYSLIDIEVDINKARGNDSLNYYYYLTTKPNSQDIKIFTGIADKSSNNNKIVFTLNTKDIPNFDEISNENTIYLFIEEIAKNGGNQSTAISNAIKLDTTDNVEEYVNNVKHNNSSGSSKGDDTVADKDIPQTGISPVVILSIIFIGIGGIIIFIRYKVINDNMK